MTRGCQFLYYPGPFWLPYNFSSGPRPGISLLIYSKVQAKERPARGSRPLWQLLQQQPSPALAPYSPSMFLLTAPQSQTQAPSSSTLTLRLHTLYTPHTLQASHLHPSTLVHTSPREIVRAGLHTPSPHFAPPTPTTRFLSHTSACLPALHTLHSLTRHTGLPSHRDPGFLTLSVHTTSHKVPHRRLPSTSTAVQKHSPHSHFPSLSSSSLVPRGIRYWDLCICILSTPLLSQAHLTTVSHTHTHTSNTQLIRVVVTPLTPNTLSPVVPHSLHLPSSSHISVTATHTPLFCPSPLRHNLLSIVR